MSSSSVLQEECVRKRTFPLALRRRWPIWATGMFALVLGGLLAYGYGGGPSLAWAAVLATLTVPRLILSEERAVLISRLLFTAGPLVSYSLVEVLNGNAPWTSFSPLQICLNLIWYYIGAALLYLLTGRRNLATQLGITLGWGLGMINHYVTGFRGRTLFPGDLLTLRTAFNVAGKYDYTPDTTQVTTGLVVLLCLLLLFLLPRQQGRRKPNLRVMLPAAGLATVFLVVFFSTNFLAKVEIVPSMWTTRENGLLLNFTVCLRYSKIEMPEGYSTEELTQLAGEHTGDAVTALAPTGAGTRPVNVLAVMNESFSDLSVLPSVEFNQDCMPFWNSLTENTVRGYAYASVFGGTTANSEYEFLTGNTTAFLPPGTVPYQMYVGEGDPSLVAQMETLGYQTLAMHPYLSSGWNRIPVYRHYGFDRALFQPQFEQVTMMRSYVSDQSNFENLVAQYEQKPTGEPFFAFNITMQNHSAYNEPWTGLERTTWLTGKYGGQFSTVDQYLSLVYQSDRAFKYLIDYFSQVEEPTLILMFGDHQPQVATNFYTQALGTNPSAADAQRKQAVPFLIWANYDIPEEEGLEISLNYLSTLLMKTANLPLTGYQTYLEELSKTLPVINAVGYRTEDGVWVETAEALPEPAQSALAQYQKLLYNNIFDKGERIPNFFFLDQ